MADLTGLTRTTVSRVVSELAGKWVVWEVEYGEASPRGGRKPIRLKLNDDVFGMIGLDLRREKVSGCLVHLGGALEAELSCPIAANASRRAILDLMHGLVDQLDPPQLSPSWASA